MSDLQSPGSMYVAESGMAGSPAILFVHGMGQSGRIWQGHMAKLIDFHCLAPDLPGFGRSNHLAPASNERITALLAELIETRVPAQQVRVVGLSWGATLALALVSRHPELVDRAIADGTPIRWPRASKFPLLYLLTATLPFKRTRWFRALFGNVMDESDLRDASRLAFWRAFAGSMEHLPPLADTSNPTLLVAGEREGWYRPSNAALATLMPHAEAWYAPGLDHCWQLQDPDLHVRMVRAWVSGSELPPELRREPMASPAAVKRLRAISTASADERRPGMESENRYLKHKSRIMWEVRFALRHYKKHLAEAYGKAEGEAIVKESLQGFEASLPGIPYIGGAENPNTQSLYWTAAWLAMYRSFQKRGASVEEAARFIYLGTESFFNGIPTRWLMRWQGRRMFSVKSKERLRRDAAISQQRRYPDDWVFEVVEGDRQSFEFGADYTECGLVKYLDREGAPELAPYLCWLDYPQFAAMHLRLDRTETIAQGGQRCDFRAGRGQPVQVEPEFLHA